MGPEGMDSRVLKELLNLTARPLTVMCEGEKRSQQGLKDLSKPNATTLLKNSTNEDPQNYKLVSLTSTSKKNYTMCPTTS